MMKKIIPHISIISSAMMLVLFVFNRVNEEMGFLRGDEFEILLLVCLLFSILTSIILITKNRKES